MSEEKKQRLKEYQKDYREAINNEYIMIQLYTIKTHSKQNDRDNTVF